MKRFAPVLLALLVGCGGSPPPKEESPPQREQKQTQNDERPYSEVGGAVKDAIRDHLGVDLTKRTPATLTLQGQDGHAPGEPIAVVVHGIDPVRESFDPLIAYLRSRKLRTYYFAYDDAQDLDVSAAELGAKLGELIDRYPTRTVWVVAHSMGGLVSRKAHTAGHEGGLTGRDVRFTLVTIASPFGGFRYADGARYDMGFGHDSWQDVGTECSFITQPGALAENVTHFKLETDEAGKTRVVNGEERSDDAVSFANQRQADVDAGAKRTLELDLGHVGVLLDPSERMPSPTRSALDDVLR